MFTSIYSTQILKVLNIKYLITDHFAIIFNINIPKPKINTQLINYRKLTNIDHELLSNSIIEINHDNISAIELNDHL